MRNAVVNVDAVLGIQCIVNTGAIVEHDDLLEEGVEVSPGAVLCGRVECGDYCWFGAGSTVLPRTKLSSDAIVAAGAVVAKHVSAGTTVAGVPAQQIEAERRREIWLVQRSPA